MPRLQAGNAIVTASCQRHGRAAGVAIATPRRGPPSRSPHAYPTVTSADSPSCSRSRTTWPGLRGLQPKTRGAAAVPRPGRPEQHFSTASTRTTCPANASPTRSCLTTLGLIGPNDSVAQILLDVLQEQVIGVYNQDDKTMYMLADNGQFGPDEKDTFAARIHPRPAGPVLRPEHAGAASIPTTTTARWRSRR